MARTRTSKKSGTGRSSTGMPTPKASRVAEDSLKTSEAVARVLESQPNAFNGPSSVVLDAIAELGDKPVASAAEVEPPKNNRTVVVPMEETTESVDAKFRQSIRWLIMTSNTNDWDTLYKRVTNGAMVAMMITDFKKKYPTTWADRARNILQEEFENAPRDVVSTWTNLKNIAVTYIKSFTTRGILTTLVDGALGFLLNLPLLEAHTNLDSIEDLCVGDRVVTTHSGSFTPTSTPRCIPRTYAVGFTIAPAHICIPRLCSCNERVALLCRQMLPSISTTAIREAAWGEAWRMFSEDFKYLFHNEGYDQERDVEAYLAHLKSQVRKVEFESIRDNLDNILHIKTDVAAFTKVEWTIASKGFESVDPRCISSFDARVIALSGPFYWWWIKQPYRKYWHNPLEAFRHNFIMTSGMNGVEIGFLISLFEMQGWYAYKGDYSRFDGHTEVECLKGEFEFYAECGMDELTLKILSAQVKTKGRTTTGHRYTLDGKRSSGGNNTTGGNGIANGAMLNRACRKAGLKRGEYKILVNGDDNHLFTKWPIDLDFIRESIVEMGHKLEIEFCPDYDTLEYCSMYYWNVGHQRVLAPKPFRTLAKTFMPSDHTMVKQEDILAHIQGVARGFQVVNYVPVLGWVCERILEGPQAKSRFKGIHRSKNPNKMTWDDIEEVDHSCLNDQFFKLYGVTVTQVEKELANCPFHRVGWAIDTPLLRHCLGVDCGRELGEQETPSHRFTRHVSSRFDAFIRDASSWLSGALSRLGTLKENVERHFNQLRPRLWANIPSSSD